VNWFTIGAYSFQRRAGSGPRFLGNGDLTKPAHLVITFWRSRVAVSNARDTRLVTRPPPSGVLLGGLSMYPHAGAASFGHPLASHAVAQIVRHPDGPQIADSPAAFLESGKGHPVHGAGSGPRLIPRGLTAKIRNGALRLLHSVFIFGVCDE
jgi:hypothetical protein